MHKVKIVARSAVHCARLRIVRDGIQVENDEQSCTLHNVQYPLLASLLNLTTKLAHDYIHLTHAQVISESDWCQDGDTYYNQEVHFTLKSLSVYVVSSFFRHPVEYFPRLIATFSMFHFRILSAATYHFSFSHLHSIEIESLPSNLNISMQSLLNCEHVFQ